MKLKAMGRLMQVGIGLPLPSLIRRVGFADYAPARHSASTLASALAYTQNWHNSALFSLIIVLLETFFVILQKIYAIRAGRGAYSGSVLDKIIKKKNLYIWQRN